MFGFGMASMIDISCTIVIDIYQTVRQPNQTFKTLADKY